MQHLVRCFRLLTVPIMSGSGGCRPRAQGLKGSQKNWLDLRGIESATALQITQQRWKLKKLISNICIASITSENSILAGQISDRFFVT